MHIKEEKLTLPGVLFIMLVAGITLTHIFFQIAALFLLFYWFVEFRAGNSIPLTLMEKFIFLYFISGTMAVFLTENPLANLPHLMPHIIVLSGIPLNWRFQRDGFPLPIIWNLLLGLTTLSALAGFYFHWAGEPRTHGLNGGYFTLASVMAFSIPFVLAQSFRQNNIFLRNVWLLVAVGHLMALWWTFTRSAFLGVLGALGLWTLMDWRQQHRQGIRIAPSITARLMLMGFLLMLIFTASDPRINPLAHTPPSSSTAPQSLDLTSGRASIYQDVFHFLKEDWQKGNWLNLLLGHGLNSRNRMVQSPYTSWESDYFQALMNQGLWGLLLIIVIYFLFLKHAWHALLSKNPLLQAAGAAAVAFWLMSFFTLKLTGFTDAALFAVLTVFLKQLALPLKTNDP